ncbi:hypothetical protein LEP1GSC059_0655 [Leptospira noguchii serovar Panama str. CZ214]|uniref:Uncharacterized protein n=1 Tax=Leptospira noguchii serovar Panama str. CZ214 TaxID=1001595 RepID=T0GSS7_9LEPT|nr:hypothetical protein LEP1GSC059_0655 [Leptospira noguchii serovar Panama str. CZ214]
MRLTRNCFFEGVLTNSLFLNLILLPNVKVPTETVVLYDL